MSFIAKTTSLVASTGDTVTIEEEAKYGGAAVAAGDQIFLWSSETQGGAGLWAFGHVVQRNATGNRVRLEITVESSRPREPLGKDDLALYRDVVDDDPRSGLARKLYRHAHNKIAALTNDEIDFLLRRFK